MSVKVPLSAPFALAWKPDGTPADGASTTTEITLDLASRTGKDWMFCAREAAARSGSPLTVAEIDADFQLQLGALASGIDPDVLLRLPIKDYRAVINEVRGFLFGSAAAAAPAVPPA